MKDYPFTLGPMEYAKTVYEGELVWFVPPVTGGKVACRLRELNLDERTCKLEVTATGDRLYKRGEVLYDVPFNRVFKRGRWDHPRFSLRWLDYPSAKERSGENYARLIALVNSQQWNK